MSSGIQLRLSSLVVSAFTISLALYNENAFYCYHFLLGTMAFSCLSPLVVFSGFFAFAYSYCKSFIRYLLLHGCNRTHSTRKLIVHKAFPGQYLRGPSWCIILQGKGKASRDRCTMTSVIPSCRLRMTSVIHSCGLTLTLLTLLPLKGPTC